MTGAPSATSQAYSAAWENCDDLNIAAEEWVVKGLLPKGGLAILAGQSTAGKSFVALDVADKIARGEPALGGRRTYQCGVAYIAAEGVNGVRKRLVGLRKERGSGWYKHMALSGVAPNLADDTKYDELEKETEQLRARLARRGVRLGLVVIDTLSASIPGVDENSSKDMSSVLGRLQQLAARLSVCVLLVAHVGKDTERGVRGWSGLVANADVVLGVQMPDDAGVRRFKAVKVKDGDAGPDLAFVLRSIELGKDNDGDPVTTCVVEWRTPGDASQRHRRPRPLPAAANNTLAQLKRLMDDGPNEAIIAPGAARGTTGVPIDALRAAVHRHFSSIDAEPDSSQTLDHRRWKDRRRKSFTDGIDRLLERQLVRVEGGLIWLPDSSGLADA